MKRLAGALALSTTISLGAVAAAAAAPPLPSTITLEGATSAEGIATGAGSTFYAGEISSGDIFRGNLRTGDVTRWVIAPAGRGALGLRVDLEHGLLFVAGGFTGAGYAYDLATGAPVGSWQFGTPPGSIINDVIVSDGAAWFTDSVQPHLYRVPIGADGSLDGFTTLTVTGPAADVSGAFNMNGIAAGGDGTLIVAHSADGTLYTVDPVSGVSAAIAGATNLPNVDGILFEAGRLWAVQNFSNQITELKLSGDLTSATVVRVITDGDVNGAFQIPTTVARWGNRLAAVNSNFDTGAPPFKVVITRR